MFRGRPRTLARTAAAALSGAVLVAGAGPGVAGPAAAAPARAPRTATVSTSTTTTVPYACFVTYQGGSTIVSYPLTFTGTGPDTVTLKSTYISGVSLPPITPNPSINTSVRDVRLVLTAPPGAKLIGGHLTGGSGLGPEGAELDLEDGAAVLTAAGPFVAGTPFTLPTVVLTLKARTAGSGAVSAAGVTLSDPAFSWVRTDPADGVTQRPFACFTPPVPLTTTTLS
jgi:hypothetical protein